MESSVRRPAFDGASRADPADLDIRCFPSDDAAFSAHVHAVLASGRGSAPTSPEALESRLRASYPYATVHLQSSLGTLVPGDLTWYVFRDGGH